LNIATVDAELADFVPGKLLSAVAGRGLRGELVFPVPVILRASPSLMA